MKNYVTYKSPIGTLYLISDHSSLVGLYFDDTNTLGATLKETAILTETKKQLKEYFAGERKEFDLKIEMFGTDFQKKTWAHLKKIPYGKTWTYIQQAQSAGSKGAVRAIGTANGKNPIAIIIPCHRVIRTDGTLGGYAGGLHVKEFLLNLETRKF